MRSTLFSLFIGLFLFIASDAYQLLSSDSNSFSVGINGEEVEELKVDFDDIIDTSVVLEQSNDSSIVPISVAITPPYRSYFLSAFLPLFSPPPEA